MTQQAIAPELLAGARQLGYELISVIGRGGMGVVYRARQIDLDRIVAIKTVHTDRLDDSSIADRFRREALAVARLHHPNIVQAMNYGVVGSRHYFAMEFVDGPTAADLVAANGPMSAAAAWHYIRQTAGGLLHASNNGVLHRDIKPSNLMVVAAPEGSGRTGGSAAGLGGNYVAGLGMVKVADFGLALLDELSGNDNRLTGSGHLIGSPAYMAPERFEEEAESDHRSDIYSLGITAILLRTGVNPFEKKSLGKLVAAKARPVDRSDLLFENLEPAETELIADMLQPEPLDRIASYELLIDRIDEILDGLSPLAITATVSDGGGFNASDSSSNLISLDGITLAGAAADTQVTGPIEFDSSQSMFDHGINGDSGRGSVSQTPIQRGEVSPTLDSVTLVKGRRNVGPLWFAGGLGTAVLALVVAASILLRPVGPGPRLYTEPTSNQYMFDGETLAGFSIGGSMVGSWQQLEDPDGAYALGCDSVRGAISRTIPCSVGEDHFRLAVFVRLSDPGAQIDLDFGLATDDPVSPLHTIRISDKALLVGTKPNDFGTLTVENTVPLSVDLSQRYHVIHLERQRDDWYVFFEQQPMATIAILTETKPDQEQLIRFVIQNQAAGKPSVYLADLHCSQLDQPD